MKKMHLDTPIGEMIAIGDEEHLYLLDFADRSDLALRIVRLGAVTVGKTPPLLMIEEELRNYFNRGLKVFETPIAFMGTPFQRSVWEALRQIPYGETRSYKAQAESILRPKAYRAVANGNHANFLSLIVPCHRVISSSKGLCGYGGGVFRKKWLIEHERSINALSLL